jgi:hypothetical protein
MQRQSDMKKIINPDVYMYDYNYDNYIDTEWSPQIVWDNAKDNDWVFYGVGIDIVIPYLHLNEHLSEWEVRITHHNFWEARFLPKHEKNTNAYLLKTLRKIGPVREQWEKHYV